MRRRQRMEYGFKNVMPIRATNEFLFYLDGIAKEYSGTSGNHGVRDSLHCQWRTGYRPNNAGSGREHGRENPHSSYPTKAPPSCR